jgi:hypothetical protein
MYKGEVHVSQKALESFLKAAENLQVFWLKITGFRSFLRPSSVLKCFFYLHFDFGSEEDTKKMTETFAKKPLNSKN